MKAQYNISEDDYVSAMKLSSKIDPRIPAIYGGAAILLLIVAIFADGLIMGGAIGGLIGLIGGSVVGILIRRFINPIRARRHYREYKSIQEPRYINLREEGIEFSSPDGRTLVRWEKILKWRQNEHYLLVYLSPRMYLIIPKSIAESGFELSSLITSLQDKVGNET